MCIVASDPSSSSQPTHNCPLMSMSSDTGYLIPVSSITLHVNISPCSDKTWRAYVLQSHTIMCPAVVVTTSLGSNCVVTFILECHVYVHLKPPSHPTTTTLPVSSDVLSTTTMSLLLFVVILCGTVNSLCLLLSY